jgi:hypothetical protein
VETPVSYLEPGVTYVVQQWTPTGWKTLQEIEATQDPIRLATLPSDGLYWVVAKASRRLERVFTIHEGRQRWW